MKKNQPEFARLQSLVRKADADKSAKEIEINYVFKQIAVKLKESSKEWKLMLRLFDQEQEIHHKS